MQTFAFTGPRKLTPKQEAEARHVLWSLSSPAVWLFGDAEGLDALARDLAPIGVLFEAKSKRVWELQARSKRMVEAIAYAGGTLHAFPNKPCPTGLTLQSWQGSGTWGTIVYAHSKGVPVELHWLCFPEQVPWLEQKQLALF
ncbi:MAG: hypothetical protein HC866_22680 [Leptolyngbyaceae cyanobacterium RU_5_1]|nr:hypothetical protein [Leptolyngbyaceae cyanobacterium RU_5_1]